ncbi:MAG: hypothetical protein J0L82_10250 [Deltaproteobacteria bacterium]|jgi:hypothetical protein|nr:hypothetical protein [Deltaproteobacteria bacterium]
MSNAERLVKAMAQIPGFMRVRSTRETLPELVTYAVIQGANILTIGSGKKERFKVLMGNRGAHNKAPLVGLCHRLFDQPIEFYICKYTPAGATNSSEERELQRAFGETEIDGKRSYGEAMKYLRGQLGLNETSLEAVLLDLMETHGDILNHALRTESTAETVDQLFKGYWKKSA